jgi:hypothetical protein
MATIDQALNGTRGAASRLNSTALAVIAVSGDATVKAPITIPAGSWLKSIYIETPTAISGSPTHANVQVGLTDGGVEVVAAVDGQAQGHISATIVAALDKIGAFAAADTVLYIEAITTGGTAPAGTINVLVDYSAPVR